jgi:ABC-type transport system involved in multi-copper enzyme maturation permease subunit
MAAGGLNRVAAVAANTFRESVRQRVLYNLILFAVLMTLAGTFLNEFSLRQDSKIVRDVGLASMEFFGTLIALFIGVGLVSQEMERRSIYPLLAKPLGRGEFLIGKFLGLAVTLLVNVSVMTLGLWLTLWWQRDGRFEVGLLQAIVPIYAGLLVVVGLALLFSTLTSSTLAAVCAISVTVVGRYADILKNAGTLGEHLPGWFAHVTRGLFWLLPNLRHFDLKDRVVHGAVIPISEIAWILLYGAVYTSALLSLAYLAFRRRDFQ